MPNMSIVGDIYRRMFRGFGWLPNPDDRRDFEFTSLGLSEDVENSCTLRNYVRKVLSQGSAPSCVANAVAHGIMIREGIRGRPPEIPSRLYMFFNSRRMHQNPVKWGGTYLRTCFKALRKLGAPSEEYWPYSTRKKVVNRRPGWEPYMKAYSRTDGQYYSIMAIGPARLRQVKAAIMAGYPVCFGTSIDSAFLRNKGPAIVHRPPGGLIGGHAMTIIGYRQNSNGEDLFEVLNSWGSDWRDNGRVWLHEDYIMWARTRDLTIVKGWKGIAGE